MVESPKPNKKSLYISDAQMGQLFAVRLGVVFILLESLLIVTKI